MHNLVKFGKGLLFFIIMLTVVDVIWLAYTYVTSVNALEDTLTSVALIVAEDNCIDQGTGSGDTSSKLYSVKKLLVENATAWLCYNEDGFYNGGGTGMLDRSSRSAKHTDVQTDDNRDPATAINNIDIDFAIHLGDADNDNKYYSYDTCPQRGEVIKITMKANVNIHILSPWTFAGFGNISIPIERETTVIGMKFYKGKD